MRKANKKKREPIYDRQMMRANAKALDSLKVFNKALRSNNK